MRAGLAFYVLVVFIFFVMKFKKYMHVFLVNHTYWIVSNIKYVMNAYFLADFILKICNCEDLRVLQDRFCIL